MRANNQNDMGILHYGFIFEKEKKVDERAYANVSRAAKPKGERHGN